MIPASMRKVLQVARREFMATVMTGGFLLGILTLPATLVVLAHWLPAQHSQAQSAAVARSDAAAPDCVTPAAGRIATPAPKPAARVVAAAPPPRADARPNRSVTPGPADTSAPDDGRAEIASKLLPTVFMLLLVLAVMSSGYNLLTSTVEEKSSRVMEVLLAAVSPLELMAGKILGQFAVGLLVLAVYLGLAAYSLVALAAVGLVQPVHLLYLGVYFVLAYLTLAAVAAAAGAAVNDFNEAQTIAGPVMLLMLLPMMAWIPLSRDPDGTAAVLLSLLPPTSPFVMVMRVASSSPPPAWQIALSIAIGIASVAGAVWFAGKVFRIGLLMHGKPPNFATLLRWVRMA